jgi:hypothetical protein
VTDATTTVHVLHQVVGRSLFYNNSLFDGKDPGAGPADDSAIATDKHALLPGQTATFANYTSYSRGVNGVMLDVFNLPADPTAADFTFRVGNDGTPAAWPAAPAGITVRRGAGTGGSDRIEILWADGAILKQWLQITVQASARTGLTAADVFYFVNAVGDAGNHAADAFVTAQDELLARAHPRNLIDNPAPIDFTYDYNRDRKWTPWTS